MIYLQFLISALAIVIAGFFLVKYSDEIAEVTKLGRLFVGSLFLAGATSLPELFVDLNAIKNNLPDMAVGDLYGSSLFNLLILGIGDLIHKGQSRIFSRAGSRHALSAAISICVTAAAGLAILVESKIGGVEFAGLGVGTTAIAVIYLLGLRIIFFDQRVSHQKVETGKPAKDARKLIGPVAGYVAAAVAIVLSAPFLAEAAGEIAIQSGLGGTFIGTTLVALTTSLPELVSTIACVRRGAFDLAVGNIFGSNTFNMLLLVPLDVVHGGSLLASVSTAHVFSSLATVMVTAAAIVGQLYQVEDRKKLIEPDALAVILMILSSLVFLYFFSVG